MAFTNPQPSQPPGLPSFFEGIDAPPEAARMSPQPQLPLSPIAEAKVDPRVEAEHAVEKERMKKMSEDNPGIGKKELLFGALAAGLGALVGGSASRGLVAGVHAVGAQKQAKILKAKRDSARQDKKDKALWDNLDKLYDANPEKGASMESRLWKKKFNITVTPEQLMEQREIKKWEKKNEGAIKERTNLQGQATTVAGVQQLANHNIQNWEIHNRKKPITAADIKLIKEDAIERMKSIKGEHAKKAAAVAKLEEERSRARLQEIEREWKFKNTKAKAGPERQALSHKAWKDALEDGLNARAETPAGRKEQLEYQKRLREQETGRTGVSLPLSPAEADSTGVDADTPVDDTAARLGGLTAGFGKKAGQRRDPRVIPPQWIEEAYAQLQKDDPRFALTKDQEAPSLTLLYPGVFNSATTRPDGTVVEEAGSQRGPAQVVRTSTQLEQEFKQAQVQAPHLTDQQIFDLMIQSSDFDETSDEFKKFMKEKGLR